MDEPVFLFRDEYQADSYWWNEYLLGAWNVLTKFQWVARALTSEDLTVVKEVLEELWDTGLDETDVFPFGLLWALRSTGVLIDIPGLDDQLLAWRLWEETDHFGKPLTFLPELS